MSALYQTGDTITLTASAGSLLSHYEKWGGGPNKPPVITESTTALADASNVVLSPIAGLSPGLESIHRVQNNGSGARTVVATSPDVIHDIEGNIIAAVHIKPGDFWNFYNAPGTGAWVACDSVLNNSEAF